MKKLSIIGAIVILFTVLSLVVLSSNGSANTLYLLNWGEYIDQELVADFENEYNCTVVEEISTSSETMYQKITAGTTAYDVAIPGDYMITKLYNEGYLKKIDVNNSEYTSFEGYETAFNDKLQALRDENMPGLGEYCMPYFWGAYAMIYNTQHEDTESVVKNNGFAALFDKSLYNSNVKIGMYNTARWTISSYLMGKGIDPNLEDFDQIKMVNDIKAANFDVWGDDVLKRKTAVGDLDLCYVQLGDFFDALYLALEEGLDIKSDSEFGLDYLDFNVYVPETTAAFFDGMIIPTTSKNYDLANKFINFMLEPEHAYQNAQAIGYCPTLKSVIDLYINNPEDVYFEDEENPDRYVTNEMLTTKYEFYLDPLKYATNATFLAPKESDYMTLCETIVNQAKSSVDVESNLGTVLCIGLVCVIVGGIGAYTTVKIVKKNKKKKAIKA